MNVLEARVGAAQALTGEAYALVREHGFGLDAVDHAVLADRLASASVHLSAFIAAMLPNGEDDATAVAAVALRHRPRVDARGRDVHGYLATLVRNALRHATSARKMVDRIYRTPESRIAKSLASVTANLRIARYLVDGRPRPDETLQTVLNECRELVRRRRGDGGEAAAV